MNDIGINSSKKYAGCRLYSSLNVWMRSANVDNRYNEGYVNPSGNPNNNNARNSMALPPD